MSPMRPGPKVSFTFFDILAHNVVRHTEDAQWVFIEVNQVEYYPG